MEIDFLNDFSLTFKLKQTWCLRSCISIIHTRNQTLSKKVVRKFVPPIVYLLNDVVTINCKKYGNIT